MVELRELIIIASLAENRVIGRDGDKPWNIPGDSKRFDELTKGHPTIMGRKTLESLWRRLKCIPLPECYNIVLSKTMEGFGPRVNVARFFEEGVDYARIFFDSGCCPDDGLAYVIGGEGVFRIALGFPLTKGMELTYVKGAYVGDRYFPEFGDEWGEIRRRRVEWNPEYSFVSYRR